MFTIQLRNFPESLYLAIKESARAAKRSMTKQAIVLMEQGLQEQPNNEKTKKEAYSRLKEMAENTKKVGIQQVLDYIEVDDPRYQCLH